MLISIHPNLVEITFGVCVAVLWNSNKILALFSHECFCSGCSLTDFRKKIQYCIPLNKFLLMLISWVEVPSWRENLGSVDGFIVLVCGR